jgi:hypothetical protein
VRLTGYVACSSSEVDGLPQSDDGSGLVTPGQLGLPEVVERGRFAFRVSRATEERERRPLARAVWLTPRSRSLTARALSSAASASSSWVSPAAIRRLRSNVPNAPGSAKAPSHALRGNTIQQA